MFNFKTICLNLVFISVLLTSHAAQARTGFKFGDSETLHKIQDIDMPGPKGEKLYLANRTITNFVFLGVYLSDKGYVLAVTDDDAKGYYPLEEVLIKKLQAEKMLPTPLPKYKISIWEYLVGYSLWIVVFILIAWTLFQNRNLFKKTKSQE